MKRTSEQAAKNVDNTLEGQAAKSVLTARDKVQELRHPAEVEEDEKEGQDFVLAHSLERNSQKTELACPKSS